MADLISTFPALPLTYACTVVWEARDPASGGLVTGVTITDPVLYGVNLTPSVVVSSPGADLTALFTPLPLDDQADDLAPVV